MQKSDLKRFALHKLCITFKGLLSVQYTYKAAIYQ